MVIFRFIALLFLAVALMILGADIVATLENDGKLALNSLGDLWELGIAEQLGGDIVASTPTPTGLGYYMVGADGGVFAFGDATFSGSIQEVVNDLVGNRMNKG